MIQQFGTIDMIKIEIPWTSLFPTCSKPVVVRVSGVLINVSPSLSTSFDAEKEKERAKKAKKQKLEEYEKSLMEDKAQSDPNFVERLVASIINNIQVHRLLSYRLKSQVFVENVHIRFEDSVSSPGHPYAFGNNQHPHCTNTHAASTTPAPKPQLQSTNACRCHTGRRHCPIHRRALEAVVHRGCASACV